MEIKNFTITKRDGSKDRFSLDKIMNAIVKAFESVNVPADLSTISKILSHLDMHDDIKVEDIQNQVEEALMREGTTKWLNRSCCTDSSTLKTVRPGTPAVPLGLCRVCERCHWLQV